jgi:hypothetical protein
MNEQAINNIPEFTKELTKMSQAVYMACDASIAADICLKTRKAIKLIEDLEEENRSLRAAVNGRNPDGSLIPSEPFTQSN